MTGLGMVVGDVGQERGSRSDWQIYKREKALVAWSAFYCGSVRDIADYAEKGNLCNGADGI